MDRSQRTEIRVENCLYVKYWTLTYSILYVNLVAKGAPKFFKTLAPRLTVLDIPYFADAYSRIVRPIDLHNF